MFFRSRGLLQIVLITLLVVGTTPLSANTPPSPSPFSGIDRLYSNVALYPVKSLSASSAIVVGLGGVGSWTVEALARSGVGTLTLIDLDDICTSNINRQIHATISTVGQFKATALKARVAAINPDCKVTTILDFITLDNLSEVLPLSLLSKCSVLVDCIDDARVKSSIISACRKANTPIITVGASGNLKDPTRVVTTDITKAGDDRLLKWVRKHLRKTHGYPKGPGNGVKNHHDPRPWGVEAVFSEERFEERGGVVSAGSGGLRRCDTGMGTACFATGTMGFVAASRAVDIIVGGERKRQTIKIEERATTL